MLQQRQENALPETSLLVFFAGLASHQFFRKYEPTISSFFRTIGLLEICLIAGFRFRYALPFISFLKLISISNTIYFFTLGTSILIYRLFLHPLRNYPGPFYARISRWEWFFRIREGHHYRYCAEMHKKYGDVVRIGPNDLIFVNPEDAPYINGPPAKLQKGPIADGSPWAKAKSVTFVRDRNEHKYRRRIWDHGFTPGALKNYEPRLTGLLDIMSRQFSARLNQEIDFASWASYFAFDAMGDLGFGSDFQMLATGKPHLYSKFIHQALQMRMSWGQIPWSKYIVGYLPVDREVKSLTGEFLAFGDKKFYERKEKGTSRPDVFTHLLAQDEESGGRLTEDELKEDARTVIIAGSDTTSFAITAFMFLLVQNPEKYKLLQEEVDALNKDGPVKGTEIGPEEAPYIHGAINEILRLFPPAPEASQRTYGDAPYVVNGKFIPPQTFCYISLHAMQRDERNFSQAESFIPERWIESKRPKNFNHVKKAFAPFGSGVYNCVGRPLAMLEMRLFVATILYRFQLSPGPNFSSEKFLASLRSNSTMESGGLPLIITERNVPRQW